MYVDVFTPKYRKYGYEIPGNRPAISLASANPALAEVIFLPISFLEPKFLA